jgi:transposase
MNSNILRNHTVTDDEWAVVSSLFPADISASALGGRPRYSNRVIFRALLYWLADGLPKRRLKQYVGIS